MCLRYEEFARDPASALTRITNMVEGCARPSSAFLNRTQATLSPNHTAYGNRSRFLTGEVAIQCDETWREEMPGEAQAPCHAARPAAADGIRLSGATPNRGATGALAAIDEPA
jgi:hypothetical protein